MRYNDLIENDDDDLFGNRVTDTIAQHFDFPEGGDLGYAIGGGGITYSGGHQTEGLVIVSKSDQQIAFIPDFTYFDGEPTQEDLGELFYDDDPEYGTHREPLTLRNIQKFMTLDESDENDDELFAPTDRVKKNLTIATFNERAPLFQKTLQTLIARDSSATAREIQKELGRINPMFKGLFEIYELADMMLDEQLTTYVPSITQWIAQDPSSANDEDHLQDYFTDIGEDIRHKSELWIYVTEIMEDMYDEGDLSTPEEIEFDCAMIISGELAAMMVRIVPEAFAAVTARALSESTTDEYQQMVNFVRSNRTPGVPEDQQVAMALFKQLGKQQQANKELQAELGAAEKRIDVAAQGGEMARQELRKHQHELDREREDIAQQQSAMDQTTQTFTARDKASKEQIQSLAKKLETIKSTPGVSDDAAKKIEAEINDLKKKNLTTDKVKEIERSISIIHQSNSADDKTINDLIAKVNDAQARAKDFEQDKKEIKNKTDDATLQALDQLKAVKQRLANLGQVERQVAAITPIVADIKDVSDKVGELDGENEHIYQELKKHDTVLRKLAPNELDNDEGGIVDPIEPEPKPQPKPGPQFNPPAIPNDHGDLENDEESFKKAQAALAAIKNKDLTPAYENKFFEAIKWATKK